jgi:AcrR family transcriptional regulator
MKKSGTNAPRGATDAARGVANAARSRRNVAGSRDPRCTRTRAAILEAYVSLCGERGNEFAGVAEICRRARVNKATFYRHFEDRADLLDRGLEGFFAEIGERIDPATVEEGRTWESMARRIEDLFGLVEEHARLLRPILSGAGGSILRRKAEAFLEDYLQARRVARLAHPGQTFALPRDAIPRALASLGMGLASWWLDHPGAATSREIAAYYLSFISSGLFSARR